METHEDIMRRLSWGRGWGFGHEYAPGLGRAWSEAQTDKNKRRAGVTKNNRRGQSKARRHMTRASRRRNRG